MQVTLEDRIRDRAYFISQAHGGAGDDAQFWLMAEREVLAEIAAESAAAEIVAESAAAEVAAESRRRKSWRNLWRTDRGRTCGGSRSRTCGGRCGGHPRRRTSEIGKAGEADCHAPDNGNDEGRGAPPEEGCIEVPRSRQRLGEEACEGGPCRCSDPNSSLLRLTAPPATTESPSLQPTVVTPIKSAAKTQVKPAVSAATKTRAAAR